MKCSGTWVLVVSRRSSVVRNSSLVVGPWSLANTSLSGPPTLFTILIPPSVILSGASALACERSCGVERPLFPSLQPAVLMFLTRLRARRPQDSRQDAGATQNPALLQPR